MCVLLVLLSCFRFTYHAYVLMSISLGGLVRIVCFHHGITYTRIYINLFLQYGADLYCIRATRKGPICIKSVETQNQCEPH